MRIVISAVCITVLGILAYISYINFPTVKQIGRCHTQLTAFYNQKGLITRHSYLSELQICQLNKELILKGVLCYIESDLPLIPQSQLDRLKATAGQWLAKSSTAPLDAIIDHNNRCPTKGTRVAYDLTSPSPFAANF